MAKSLNKNLRDASKAKKDEFYAQLVDIEKELKHDKDQFRGKVVCCNCDDPYESNFFKYFASNFNALGLKKLSPQVTAVRRLLAANYHSFKWPAQKANNRLKLKLPKYQMQTKMEQ